MFNVSGNQISTIIVLFQNDFVKGKVLHVRKNFTRWRRSNVFFDGCDGIKQKTNDIFRKNVFFFARDHMIFCKDIVVEDRNGIAGKGLATTWTVAAFSWLDNKVETRIFLLILYFCSFDNSQCMFDLVELVLFDEYIEKVYEAEVDKL